MSWPHRLPARLRLTLAFAVAMVALFAGSGAALYVTAGTALLDELDTGLRARAAIIESDLSDPGFRLASPSPELLEPTEVFAQILSRDGHVIDSTPGIPGVTLPNHLLGSLTAPRFLQAKVAGVAGTSRILALQAMRGSTPVVLIVGSEMSDRDDALHRIAVVLSAGGPIAVITASVIGWLLAGAALRPIERMRRQASAISASGLDRRLSIPEAKDEFRRLAVTLNEMLSRLDASMKSERRFLDNASHELRTPLTALKAELDIALLRPRAPEDLAAALRSASEEANRLSRMADDLLVLSRSQGGIPMFRTDVSLHELVTASGRLFEVRAATGDVRIDVNAPNVTVFIDQARVRQAVDNLLDNAIRYAPKGSAVTVQAELKDHIVRIIVEDSGPGFPSTFRNRAFAPFEREPSVDASGQRHQGTGLGLAIVAAVADGHGGAVTIESHSGDGARVVLSLAAGITPTGDGMT